MTVPTDFFSALPAKVRKGIYATYGALSVVAIGVTAYYGAIPALTVPDAVVGGLAVLGALAAPISVLAVSNVSDTNVKPERANGL